MKAFPTPVSRWTPVHEDKAPEVQGGVNSDINGEKTVHWYGRVSELADGGRAIKFPKGYLPERYVVKAEPIVDNVGIYGAGVTLSSGTSIAVTATAKKMQADGSLSGSGESGAGFSSGVSVTAAALAAAKEAYDEGLARDPSALVATATVSGSVVTDHDEYIELATSGSGLDRATNDCFVDVRFVVRQVDPMVEFHH